MSDILAELMILKKWQLFMNNGNTTMFIFVSVYTCGSVMSYVIDCHFIFLFFSVYKTIFIIDNLLDKIN